MILSLRYKVSLGLASDGSKITKTWKAGRLKRKKQKLGGYKKNGNWEALKG